jgi:alkyl hydroperoxide reductase subunit AhpF
MEPLAADTRARIGAAVADLTGPVSLHYYTSDVDTWYSRAERALLEAVAAASPRIRLEIHAGRWDPAREAAVGIRRTPAIALAGARDTGIRYYGVPDGYELETFLAVVRTAAGGASPLAGASIERLRRLPRPVHLEVLVSPS